MRLNWNEDGLNKILTLVGGTAPTQEVVRGYTFQGKLNSHLKILCKQYAHHRLAVWNWGVEQLKNRYQAHQDALDQLAVLWHTSDCEGAPEVDYKNFQTQLEIQRCAKAEFKLAQKEKRKAKVPVGYQPPWYDMNTISVLLTQAKHTTHPWLQETLASVHTQALEDLSQALKRFFEKKSGFPHFKSRGRSDPTFRFQMDSRVAGVSLDLKKGGLGIRLPGFWKSPTGQHLKGNLNKKVKFSKGQKVHTGRNRSCTQATKDQFKHVEWIRLQGGRFPTALPSLITVRVDKLGKVQVSFTVKETVTVLPQTGKAIGLDLGLTDFVVDSEGERYNNTGLNSKAVNQYREQLAKAQQALSRRAKGSTRWEEARRRIARLQQRIAHQRKDFQQKLSTYLVQNFSFLALEDLDVKGLLGKRKRSRSIQHASWSQFVRMVEYKGQWHQRWVQKIDRFYPSSQLCSTAGCTHQQKMPLFMRVFNCPKCGHPRDRDWNAARNILKQGLELLWAFDAELERLSPASVKIKSTKKGQGMAVVVV